MANEGQSHVNHRRRDAPSGSGAGYRWVNMDLARLCLLWALIALYMLFGAIIFSALERPGEVRAQSDWDAQVSEFARNHEVSLEDLHMFLKQYEEATTAGVRADPCRSRWDFSGSFYFVATVVSTIGFGMTAPCTICGKIFLIPYGLFGCAAGLLFFNLFLERVITLVSFLMYNCSRRRRKKAGVKATDEEWEEEEEDKEWKPSVYYVTLILGALALLVACGASGLYSAVEGWGYFESMYFCFVTFSTMGFGDLVSGQKEWYAVHWLYQVGNSLVILLGVCCTYSLFNIMSIIIKQALNWMLAQLLGLRRGCHSMCTGGSQRDFGNGQEGSRGVFCLCCCCCSYPPMSHDCGGGGGDGGGGGQSSLNTQLRLTATQHGRRWSFSVVRFAASHNLSGKCCCNSLVVEKICKAEDKKEAERDPECQGCRQPREVTSGTGHLSDRCSSTLAKPRQNSLPEGVGAIAMLNNRLQETRINT